MNVTEPIKSKIKSMLASRKFAVLSTYGDGQPYANLVAFSHDEDLDAVFFATKSDTRKFENLQQCPRVALLIENTSNIEEDIHHAAVLTIIGQVDPQDPAPDFAAIERYIRKHPYLSNFVWSQNCILVKVRVKKLIWVENFQNVTILENTPSE